MLTETKSLGMQVSQLHGLQLSTLVHNDGFQLGIDLPEYHTPTSGFYLQVPYLVSTLSKGFFYRCKPM